MTNDLLEIDFAILCSEGDISKVKLFYAENQKINLRANHECAFRLSCKNGHLHIAQWLWNVSKEKIKIETYHYFAFRKACKNGHLNTALWIRQIGGADAVVENSYSFRKACSRGHLILAKWIFQTFRNIKIHDQNFYAFRFAAINGHFNVVKWLFSLDGKISREFTLVLWQDLFCQICENGHSEIAKWIFETSGRKIDIRIYIDYPFRMACINNHNEVAKWLSTLCGSYQFQIENDRIINFFIK